MSSPIEIALAADANYYCGLLTTAYSMARFASSDASLRFHILFSRISAHDREFLGDAVKRVHPLSEIIFHDVANAQFEGLSNYHGSKMTYTRLLLPSILQDCKHCIYSDVDTLWIGDIQQLWNEMIDISSASQSSVFCTRERSPTGIRADQRWFEAKGLPFDPDRYINAGISFYKLDVVRRDNVFAAVLAFGRKYPDCIAADQSMLYGAMGKDVGLIDDKWQNCPRFGGNEFARCLHYVNEIPWYISRTTKLLTDTQLLWFWAYASAMRETTWNALRRFYSVFEILVFRGLFLLLYRPGILRKAFASAMRLVGHGPYDEALEAPVRNRLKITFETC